MTAHDPKNRITRTQDFCLTIDLEKSVNLDGFDKFPFDPAGLSVTEEGLLKYRFRMGDDTAFFRVLGRPVTEE